MSINEFPATPASLTEKQEREAMAAVYGLQGAPMHPNTQTELSYEERVKMRRMLDELDQKQAGGLKEFDLNKPPVPPYAYSEYPFLLYNHQTKQTRAAMNPQQRQQMIASGWSEDPVPVENPEVALTATELMQADEIDRRLKMSKDQLEAEQSAGHMAAMRAEIEELRSLLRQQQDVHAHDAGLNGEITELETAEKSARKRSK